MADTQVSSCDVTNGSSGSERISINLTFQRISTLRVVVLRTTLPRDKLDSIYEVILKEMAKTGLHDDHRFVSATDALNRHLATGAGLQNFCVLLVAQSEKRMREELSDGSRRGGF